MSSRVQITTRFCKEWETGMSRDWWLGRGSLAAGWRTLTVHWAAVRHSSWESCGRQGSLQKICHRLLPPRSSFTFVWHLVFTLGGWTNYVVFQASFFFYEFQLWGLPCSAVARLANSEFLSCWLLLCVKSKFIQKEKSGLLQLKRTRNSSVWLCGDSQWQKFGGNAKIPWRDRVSWQLHRKLIFQNHPSRNWARLVSSTCHMFQIGIILYYECTYFVTCLASV